MVGVIDSNVATENHPSLKLSSTRNTLEPESSVRAIGGRTRAYLEGLS